jgi:hypothetical protein
MQAIEPPIPSLLNNASADMIGSQKVLDKYRMVLVLVFETSVFQLRGIDRTKVICEQHVQHTTEVKIR